MTEIDGAKEEIAYLKLWLGIMVVTGISLIGWLLGNFRSAHWLLVGSGLTGDLYQLEVGASRSINGSRRKSTR
jgi:hypothetical protein